MKELTKQIKEKSFHKVYLLTGDEPYLVLQAKHMLKNAMIKEGDTMNYAAFTDGKIDLNTLQELAFTYPFFSEKRLLLLDGTGILKTGKDEFVSIMENMPETTCIIVCEPEVDKRSKVYKWIKKNGYVGEFLKKNQTEKVLLRWIAALLGKEKKQIRENNARYFLQKTGDDMFQIKNEIDKLIAYAGDREEITQADIDAVASGEVQDKIFDLVDAIARKNKAAALSYYNAIAKTAGIPRFAIRKNEQQLRGYGEKMLEKCIEECIQIEEEIKTGRINDQIGVESLICRLML